MINALLHFHFIRPFWLWAFIPLVLIFWFLIFRSHTLTNWQKVCDKHLLPHLLTTGSNEKTIWPRILAFVAFFFAIIAMAGPTWSRQPQAVYQALNSKVIVLDMSQSMDASDIAPTRLQRAKYKVLDILKQLKDARVGMVVFTSEPFVLSPLTKDANTISLLVPTLNTSIMPVQGSNISAALLKAQQLLQQGGASSGGQIILITDSNVTNQDVSVARDLASQGITTSVLGIGSEQGAPIKKAEGGFVTDNKGNIILPRLNVDALNRLAEAGNGRYINFTNDDRDVESLLLPSISDRFNQQAKLSKQMTDVWQDQGRWFILISLLIALLAFRRGFLLEVLR